MDGELLLEIGTEELPAGFIAPALQGMKSLLQTELAESRLTVGPLISLGTPRRLALCAQGLAGKQGDTVYEVMGPPEKVAFDVTGKPTKALEAFASRSGVSVTELRIVATKKGNYVQATKQVKGKETASLLPDILRKVILNIPFPKSMRWADLEVRFARPIKWILAIFDGTVIPGGLEFMESSNTSWGHRFLCNQPFEVSDLVSYLEGAESHYVIPDIDKRKRIIQEEAQCLANEVGGEVLEDLELLDTVANLVEYPVTLRGTFSRSYLSLPRDVLICSMREHQKYFAVVDSEGQLLPYFIVVSNNRALNEDVVIKGNERVLAARLTDARFFFDEDRKVSLHNRAPELQKVIYQASLGSMYEKVLRVKDLARYLADQVDKHLVEKIERAALLCKADLLSEMVGEFPALQGSMGREYALLDGESPDVAIAICEHYLPLSGKGKPPDSVLGCLLSIVDKMDNIVGCFGIGLIPTGTADPHALRRQALGIINIILERSLSINLPALIARSAETYGPKLTRTPVNIAQEVLEFIRIRFHYHLTAKGFDYDIVEAATAVRFADLADVFDRIRVLQQGKAHPSFKPLAITFKRLGNISASQASDQVDPALLKEDAEQNLYATYLEVQDKVRKLMQLNDYGEVLTQLALLKPAVDTFFEKILVMCEEKPVKENRIGLLKRVTSLFQEIADFSKIVTEA